MKITEVRIFPTESKDGKLKAFATMTFDDWFVVRNVKVIQGNNGLFVAMPSRKAVDACLKCKFKNVVGSRYCNQCGMQLSQPSLPESDEHDKYNNHMDIAHPITQECRVYIQEKILEAYNKDVHIRREDGDVKQKMGKVSGNTIVNNNKMSEEASKDSPEKVQSVQDLKEETIEIQDSKDIEL